VLDKALSLNSSGRFQTAKEFREALRSVGRSEFGQVDFFNETAGESGMSGPLVPDPFDSYSILKPDDMAWSTPRRSWSIPAMICGVGVVAVLAFIGSSFVSSAPKAERAVADSVKAAASRNPGPNTTVRESKSERQRPSASETPTMTSTHDASSGSGERQKRNAKRVSTPVKPLAPSLDGALRLPDQ
jgi:hypothetical protein